MNYMKVFFSNVTEDLGHEVKNVGINRKVSRYIHTKYKTRISFDSKVMVNLNCSKGKHICTYRQVLPQGIHMCFIRALSFLIKNIRFLNRKTHVRKNRMILISLPNFICRVLLFYFSKKDLEFNVEIFCRIIHFNLLIICKRNYTIQIRNYTIQYK